MTERVAAAEHRLEEIQESLSRPETAADPARLRALLKEQGSLQPVVDAGRALRENMERERDCQALLESEEDAEMREMVREELAALRAERPALEKALQVLLLPKDPNDEKNVVVEIRAGAGGEEAALFAASLYRMYARYAERCRWRTEVNSVSDTELGGIKEIVFTVTGQNVYSRLKYESGVHRVQRVPETETGGRIHTSTCTVAIMPEAEEVDVQIDEKDIRVDVMRSSGNGGQSVNTTDSAVRLTHFPTGIVIYSQTEKSQLQNKNKAFALLRTKLYDIELKKAHEKEAAFRRLQVGTGDRSEKIRTYNFPQGRVTDHRIHLTIYRIDEVVDGDLDLVIGPLVEADTADRLAALQQEEA